MAAKCGDGFTRGGVEVCDDGNNSNTDACTNACVAARCGDTFIRAGVEECDDGNSNNSDACVQGCANAECGDGFVRSSVEECEIGVAGWTSTTCRAADCGRNYYRKCSSSSPCAAGETCAGDVGMCTTLVAGNYNACKDPPPNYSKWGADDICAMECLVGVCPKDLFCVTDSSKQFVGTCVGSGPAF